MPAKAAAAAPRNPRAPPAFHRADADTVQAALDRLLVLGIGHYPSQAAFLRAFRPALRAEDPSMRISGPRLRSLLVETQGVRLLVRFRERSDEPPPSSCPVCAGPLLPIRNRTLTGEVVALGLRCLRCGYWMHRRRRVPVRYTIQRVPRRGSARKGSGEARAGAG
ncbi:MAG TPA: hypothetical protein VGP88_07135 [Thermoplasmata archaeon]|nr:hypothetical protein [Thermoplasmata archaeon]